MKIDETKIFCVTLRNTPDRKELAQETFSLAGLNVEFFYGVDGASLNIDDLNVFEMLDPNKRHWKIRNGVVGCWLSHFLLWNVLLRKSWTDVLIFEDDSTLIPNFKEEFEQRYNKLPHDWEVFLLGGPTGTYGYMVKRAVLRTMIDRTSVNLIDVDICLREGVFKDLKCYTADPVLVTEKSVNGGNMPKNGVWKSLTYDWNDT